MKSLIRKILIGDTPVSEYSTITVPGEITERVFLKKGSEQLDISAVQWLLCLKPVVFGIWFLKKNNADLFIKETGTGYKMYFNDNEKRSKTVAVLELSFLDKIEEPDGTLLLLKLVRPVTHHINLIKTLFLYYRHYKKPEQDLTILRSFSAAYSYPRKVRLISFKEGRHFNIFPMDLVGDIPQSKRYVFGLRHSNVTLQHIIETKKIVVSEIPYEKKNVIYQLGKHHRDPLSVNNLPFDISETEKFHFPISTWANSYKEIEIVKTMNLGSHMLLWGEEINEKILSVSTGHLFHIHFLHYLHQQKKGSAYPLV